MSRYLPLVTAHSGCEDTPDNTLESVKAGIDAGADTVELDVRARSDGTPVLMHDAENPGQPATVGVTTLEEALRFLTSQSVMLNLDLKDDACIDGVIRLVRDYRLDHGVILTGCTPSRAAVLRRQAPELPVLLNAELSADHISKDRYTEFVAATCRTAVSHHCCGVNVAYDACREELVTYCLRRYLPVSVWTVNDEPDMVNMIGLGVHSITTHRPRRLVSLIKARA